MQAPAEGHVIDLDGLTPIDRHEMARLARTEYDRLLDLLRQLDPADWDRATACEGWTVRDIVAHLLGAGTANASQRENLRQMARGRRWVRGTGRPLVDGINEVQIADRRHLTTDELVAGLAEVADRAILGRRRTPSLLRRLPVPSPAGGRLTLGHLVDVVYTRDQWMHRVDLADGTGRALVLTAEQDGRIVADVVREWARTHGQPVTLELTGPAGGTYRQGAGGPTLQLDAVAFCLAVSGRAPGEGLLRVPVVF
jgi:uncharacterized protein (TIGR03083 family)